MIRDCERCHYSRNLPYPKPHPIPDGHPANNSNRTLAKNLAIPCRPHLRKSSGKPSGYFSDMTSPHAPKDTSLTWRFIGLNNYL